MCNITYNRVYLKFWLLKPVDKKVIMTKIYQSIRMPQYNLDLLIKLEINKS